MTLYSISDLEKLSGIKAHTIRIWEQRYSILEPKRTASNIRYYEDKDLKNLLNVVFLRKNGHKISKIAEMTDDDLANALSETTSSGVSQNVQIDTLTLAMMEMDEQKFNNIIDVTIKQLGFEKTMIGVIYPFLERLSMLWLTGSVAHVQESFISNLIRQKLISATNEVPVSTEKTAKKIVLYLPEGERQELSLQLLHYLLKKREFKVTYLGGDVTLADVSDAVSILNPDYIFTMITETYVGDSVNSYVLHMRKLFPEVHLLLSGYQVVAQNVLNTEHITVLRSLDETMSHINVLN